MFGPRTIRLLPALAGLAALAVVLAVQVQRPQAFEAVNERLFDRYQVLAPRPFNPEGVVRIVDIDEASLGALGQWPWPRSFIAALVERLTAAGAAAIAFDIMFSEPDRTSPKRIREIWERYNQRFFMTTGEESRGALKLAGLEGLPDHDETFSKALAAGPTILGTFLTGTSSGGQRPPLKAGISVQGSPVGASLVSFAGAIPNLPELAEAASGVGSVSLAPEEGELVRRVPMVSNVGGVMVPALGVEALRVAQGSGSYILRATDASGEIDPTGTPRVGSMRVGQIVLPLDADGSFRIHYAGNRPERLISAREVLAGPVLSPALAGEMRGRIVLVGTSAPGLRDLVATPLAPTVPGVVVHAEIIEQAVEGAFLTRPDWAPGAELAAAGGLGLVACVLLLLGLPALGLGFMVAAPTAAFVTSWVSFTDHALLLGPVAPALAVAVPHLSGTVASYFVAERGRREIIRQFEHFVAPGVIAEIIRDPERHLTPHGDQRDLSVLFLDIRRFSTLTETMPPQQVIAFVNGVMTPLTEVILEHEGTVDKYMGDAIMAFWNAPRLTEDMETRAVACALEMLEALEAVNEGFNARGLPSVDIGIGVNTGICSVGNMGSTRRLSYTCVGDPVNLAARLEGLTGQYGVETLIGSRTAAAAQGFALLALDLVAVKGRRQPEWIWTVAGDARVAADPAFADAARTLEAAREAYFAMRWDEAETRFGDLAALGRVGRLRTANLASIFLGRIAAFRESPPPQGWNGVHLPPTK